MTQIIRHVTLFGSKEKSYSFVFRGEDEHSHYVASTQKRVWARIEETRGSFAWEY